jgi:hypothetical protein
LMRSGMMMTQVVNNTLLRKECFLLVIDLGI